MRGKSIVFCLPGRNCSYTFLKSFVQLAFDLVQNGMNIQISQDYSSMVNFARCKVLGANVLRGPKQVPWDGKLPYDYQLWIDNDIVFTSEKFWQLCDLAVPGPDKDGNEVPEREIAAGWYATEDGMTTSVAHWLDEDDFRKNGGVMNHETVESMAKRRKPFTVDYTGFGWVLIRKGVFERLEYPWFAPKMQVFESGGVQDMCGEDVSFCLDAKEAGVEPGATLVFVLVTKNAYYLMDILYNICYNGEILLQGITLEESTEVLQDLSERYYEGEPINPSFISLEPILD